MDEKQVKEKMVRALRIAKDSWKEANMPEIINYRPEDTGRISLAIIAVKIYDQIR